MRDDEQLVPRRLVPAASWAAPSSREASGVPRLHEEDGLAGTRDPAASDHRRSASGRRQLEAGQAPGQLLGQPTRSSTVLRVWSTACSVLTATRAIGLHGARRRASTPRTCSAPASEMPWASSADVLRTLAISLRWPSAPDRHLIARLDFARTFLHRDHRLLGLGLDVLDEDGDVLRRLGGRSASLRTSSATTREAQPGLAGARRLDGGVEGEQVGLRRDVLDRFTISEISSERSPRPLIFLAMPCTSPRIRCMPARLSLHRLLALAARPPAPGGRPRAEASALAAPRGRTERAHWSRRPGSRSCARAPGPGRRWPICSVDADHLAGAARHADGGVADVAAAGCADLLDHHVDGVDDAAEHVRSHLAAPGRGRPGRSPWRCRGSAGCCAAAPRACALLVALGLGLTSERSRTTVSLKVWASWPISSRDSHLDRLAEVAPAHALGHPHELRDGSRDAAGEDTRRPAPPPPRCRRSTGTGTSRRWRRRRR